MADENVKLTFLGLNRKQAKTLAEWFEGQGEQDCVEWFLANSVKPPLTDVMRPGGYRELHDNGDVVVHCYTPTPGR